MPKDRIKSPVGRNQQTAGGTQHTPSTATTAAAFYPAVPAFPPSPWPSMSPTPFSFPPAYPIQMPQFTFHGMPQWGYPNPSPFSPGLDHVVTPRRDGPQPSLNSLPTIRQAELNLTPKNSERITETGTNLHAWCSKHNLGSAEFTGLSKLGFVVGKWDELRNLDAHAWEWAGLGPLHQMRIKAACSADSMISDQ
jgi:hypothetical protein